MTKLDSLGQNAPHISGLFSINVLFSGHFVLVHQKTTSLKRIPRGDCPTLSNIYLGDLENLLSLIHNLRENLL